MELRRVGLVNAGLLIILSAAMGGTAQEPSLWLASHLENGQRIYMSGITAQGRVVQNSHGMEGVGCAMCHGPDGHGGMMHDIPVPNITFPFLTDPRGSEHNGRKRPAYNEETIKVAIVAGVDSGGNNLNPEMPRWTGLTARDLDDLIGFLKTLSAVRRGSPDMSQGL